VPFGSAGAVIGVGDATMFARSTPSPVVVSGATGGAIQLRPYPEASVLPTELAVVPAAVPRVGLTEAAPERLRGDSMAEIGQLRIPMTAAAVSPLTPSQRMSPESLTRTA